MSSGFSTPSRPTFARDRTSNSRHSFQTNLTTNTSASSSAYSHYSDIWDSPVLGSGADSPVSGSGSGSGSGTSGFNFPPSGTSSNRSSHQPPPQSKASWRVSQIGLGKNYGYGSGGSGLYSSRPDFKRASTSITVPDEAPPEEKGKGALALTESAVEEEEETSSEEGLVVGRRKGYSFRGSYGSSRSGGRELSQVGEEMEAEEADEELELELRGYGEGKPSPVGAQTIKDNVDESDITHPTQVDLAETVRSTSSHIFHKQPLQLSPDSLTSLSQNRLSPAEVPTSPLPTVDETPRPTFGISPVKNSAYPAPSNSYRATTPLQIDSPRRGSRTSHIAAAMELLEATSRKPSNTQSQVSTGGMTVTPRAQTPLRNRTLEGVSKTGGGGAGSGGMTTSPSISALRGQGRIRDRISQIESGSPKMSSPGTVTTPTKPRWTTAASPRTASPPLRNYRDALREEDEHSDARTELSSVLSTSPLSPRRRTVRPFSIAETLGSSGSSASGSRYDDGISSAIGEYKERVGDIRVGSMITTPSLNIIHLPSTPPLRLRQSRPASMVSTSTARTSPPMTNKGKEREMTLAEMERSELSRLGEHLEADYSEDISAKSPAKVGTPPQLPTTPPREPSPQTVSPSNFSKSKPLSKSMRKPPPIMSPRTAAISAKFSPPLNDASGQRRTPSGQPRAPFGNGGNGSMANGTGGRAKEMIERFETGSPSAGVSQQARRITPNRPGYQQPQVYANVGTKSLPATPYKTQFGGIGLGTPSTRLPSPKTEMRVNSGSAGLRIHTPSNREKPLPPVQPNPSASNQLRPPQRTWTMDEVVIPVSPPRSASKYMPNSYSYGSHALQDEVRSAEKSRKSPLKDIFGKLHGVGKKVKSEVGRRRAGTLERLSGSASWQPAPYNSTGNDVFGSRPIPAATSYSQEREISLGEGVGVARSVMSHGVRDRMGDDEMGIDLNMAGTDHPPLRESTGYYLLPPPCSTDGTAGQWIPATARLFSGTLNIEYTGNQAENRREYILDLQVCVDIASVKRDEAVYRGIPVLRAEDGAPAETGADLVELTFADGFKRYLAFDGLASRLGWVSALWDVVLASKSQRRAQQSPASQAGGRRDTVDGSPFAMGLPTSGPLVIRNRDATPTSVRATNIAGIGITPAVPQTPEQQLRDNVNNMFQGAKSPNMDSAYSGVVKDEITRQVAPPERDLSLFSRSKSLRRQASRKQTPLPEPPVETLTEENRSQSGLSFDENDLNPSRSASQRAPRAETVIERAESQVSHTGSKASRRSARPGPTPRVTPRPLPQPNMAVVQPELPREAPISDVTAKPSLVAEPQILRNEPVAPASPSSVLPVFDEKAVLLLVSQVENVKYSLGQGIDGVRSSLGQGLEGIQAAVAEQASTTTANTEAIQALPPALFGKINDVHLDLKDMISGLQGIAAATSAPVEPAAAVDLTEIHTKLDGLLAALKERQESVKVAEVAAPTKEESKEAAKESPKIMAAAVMSPLPANTEAPPTPAMSAEGEGEAKPAPADPVKELTSHVEEVLAAVKGLQSAKDSQNQQSTEMARYLGQLNGWLEKFVLDGTTEIQAMSGRIDHLVKELAPQKPAPTEGGEEGEAAPAPLGIPGLVNEMHGLMLEQKKRVEAEGSTAARVDALVTAVVEERKKQEESENTVKGVITLLEKQRQDNEALLRAVATDLSSEIRGERIRFVEAMREATTVNVNLHVEEFKKLLSAEVSRNMQELAQMREQKKALEQVLSDLFAIKAKVGGGDPVPPPKPSTPAPPARAPTQSRSSRPKTPLPQPPLPVNPGAMMASPRALPATPVHK